MCVCVYLQILNAKEIILIHLYIFWGLEASDVSRVGGSGNIIGKLMLFSP